MSQDQFAQALAALNHAYQPIGNEDIDAWNDYQKKMKADEDAKLHPPQQGRTWGEALGDTGDAVMGGFANMGGGIVHLADTLTGGLVDIGARDAFNDAAKFWQDAKSDTLKKDQAEVDASHGFLNKIGAIVSHPRVLSDILAQSAPSILPIGLASKAAYGAKMAQGLKFGPLGEEALAATEAAATKTAAGVGTAAAATMEGADAGQQAYNDVMDMTPEQLIANSSAYRSLINQGMDHKSAVAAIAYRSGLTAQMIATPIAAIAGKLTGAAKLESDLFTGHGKAGLGHLAGDLAKEGAEETIQEGGNQFGSNVGEKLWADKTKDVTDQVADNAAMGLVAGVSQGGGVHGLNYVLGNRDGSTNNSPQNDAPIDTPINGEQLHTGVDTSAHIPSVDELGIVDDLPKTESPILHTGNQSNPDDRFKFELNPNSKPVAPAQDETLVANNDISSIGGLGRAASRFGAQQQAEQQQADADRYKNAFDANTSYLDDNSAPFAAARAIGAKAKSDYTDALLNTRLPENMKDFRLLRSRYSDHLRNVASAMDTHGDALNKEPDSLLQYAAKNGGLSADAWAKEGIDPADAKVANSGFAKVFRKNGGMTPDDLAEFAHQNGFAGFADKNGNLDADAALNAVNDELSGNKRYSSQDEASLQAAQNAPAYVSELKGMGSPNEIKAAIGSALTGEKLGARQVNIVQTILDSTNNHTRDNSSIQDKWDTRARTMLANRGQKALDQWRNRDEHDSDVTTHEAALHEIMADAVKHYGIDPASVESAYTKYSKQYPSQNQLTAAMISWVSANKQNPQEHLSYEQQNRKTEPPRGSSGQSRALDSGLAVSPSGNTEEAGGSQGGIESGASTQLGNDSSGRDTGLRQSVATESPVKADNQQNIVDSANSSPSSERFDSGEDQSQLPQFADGWEKSLLRARPLAKKLGIPNYTQMRLAELVPAINAHYEAEKTSKIKASESNTAISKMESTTSEPLAKTETSENLAKDLVAPIQRIKTSSSSSLYEAMKIANTLPRGSIVVDEHTNEHGDFYHVHVAHGDGNSSVEHTRQRPDDKQAEEIASKLLKQNDDYNESVKKQRENNEAERERNKQIAKHNGYTLGKKLGDIKANDEKLMRAAFILKDHGDGTFDVQGTLGNKKAFYGYMTALNVSRAQKRARGEDPYLVDDSEPNISQVELKQEAKQPRPSDGVSVSGPQESKSKNYGAKNKLVSSDRAAELRAKLKAKLGILNSGIDPETMAAGTELAVYHIEAGVRSFVDFAHAMAEDLGTTIAHIKPYLRSWYNGARDMMEDGGENVEGMSSSDEVRESLKTLSDKKEDSKPENAGRLADYLLQRIGEINDNRSLKKAVQEFTGQDDVAPEMMKMAQEHLEMALVMNAREIVSNAKSDKEAFDKLLSSYENQPLLNVRSSTSMENQAYSTPAPLAFLAGRLAGINSSTTVYEPTAGNGMLLIDASPNNVYANELDSNRAVHLKYLGFKTTEKDGSEYLPKEKVDSAIMNPPFGSLDKFGKPSAVQYDGYTVKKIDHLITMKALESIKDDGRASIIIGANKEAGVIGNGAERVFLNWLYSHYNVVDHFEVDGDLYRRQGAGWPVRVITVNGRVESKEFAPKSGSIPRFDNWNDIYEHSKQVLDSEGFRAERHGENVSEHEPQAGNNGGSNAIDAVENSTPDGRSGGGARGERAGVARDGRKLPKPDNGNGKPASNSGNASERGHDNQHDNQLSPKSNAGEKQSEQRGSDRVGERTDVSPTDGGGGSDRKPVLGGGASEFQAEYKAASNGFNDSVLTPKNMADATQNALSHIQDEVGNIDDYVASKLEYKSTEDMHEGLMALQVDTVAAAIYNVEKRGKGIIIADQTGVGKGRQAAALIRYAILNGMTPIFVTVKPNLYSDMYGDLLDIGSKNAKPFVTNADTGIEHNGETIFKVKGKAHKDKIQSIIDNGALPAGHDMLFTTYDQLKGDSNNLRRAAISAIQKPFFILDEAHNAAGEMYSEKKVNGVKTKVTTTAGFVYESLKDKPVVYLSATYAKRPDNMPIYYRTDLLDAVDTPQELVDAVNAGGVPLQQVVASMLASNGQLFRRERSFAGIKMNFLKDSSNVSEQERISDEVNKGLRAVVEASGAFAEWYEHNHREIEPPGGSVKLAGNKADSMAGSVNPFTSVVHNYIRQLLLGIKAEKAATKAIELFKSGKKPVIALENTMGSFLAEYVEKNKLKVGDPINFNYNDILKVALERTRRVSFKNDKGDSVPLPIEIHQLDPMTRLIYSQAEEEINDIDLSALPASPIDFMLNEMRKAGMNLGEITGRGYFVDYSGSVPVLGMRTKKEKDDRRKTVDSFNNGKIDALILNSAGSTGLSIHASERFKDQSPRHMIIAQPMLDINTLMQMLGRINRTGQVELPEFTFLSLDLPAEIRPTATTKAKMAKLNANTSANDKSDTSFESPDFMNKYGDQVVNEFLQDNPDIEVATGTYSGESAPEDMALKFTGRLALLDAKIQRRVMAEILEAYSEKIEYLNKTGQNDLVAQDLKLDAYIQDSKIVHEGKDPESVFGGHTTLHKVNVKYLGKPPTADDVASAIDDALEGETPEKAMSKIIHGKDSDEKYLRDLQKRYEEAVKDHDKKKAELAAHEAKGDSSDEGDKKRNKLQNSVNSADTRLKTAAESISSYNAMRDNMRDTLSRVLKIGNRIRVDVGDENVNAVIVGVKDTHKAGSGNPWAPSKVRITMMVNSGIRQISVNYKQLMGKDGLFIESLRGSGKDGLADVFKKDFDENRREIRYIATGNLIAGSAKLDGGKITSFTDSDGNTHQGILMPRKYGKKGEYEQGNSVSSVVVRDASVLAKYLNLGGQFSEIGAFSPDKAIKVSSGRDGSLVISVPIANKNKAAFTIKLDDDLRKIVGDFYGSSKTQTAKIPAGKERPALARLMELTPLSIPAKMRDSLVAVGGDEAPDAVHSFDGKNVQSGKAPKGEIVESQSSEAADAKAEMEQSYSPKNPTESSNEPNGKVIAGRIHTNAPEKIYTTKKGKDISGVIVHGISLDDVKAEVDPYAWKMDGGVFVRMEHVERTSGDIKYSLSNQNKKSIPIAESQAVIDKLKADWKGHADVRVVDSLDDLPSDVRQRLDADGKTLDNVQGIFHPKTGIIYLNANKITSKQHAKELVFHEAYTHLGLSNLFGNDVTAIMGRLYLAMGGQKGINDLAAKHGIDLSKYEKLYEGERADYRNAVIAEELLAHMAEHPRQRVVQLAKELIGAIRAWLRKNGFAELASVNDADIAHLLKQSRETITKGKGGDTTGLIYTLSGMSKSDRKAMNESLKYSLDNLPEKTRKMIEGNGLLKMWGLLAQNDEAFKYPTSDSKDIETVFSDVAKDAGISLERQEFADKLGRKQWAIMRTTKNKETGENETTDTGMLVVEKGDEVWLNVALGNQGEGGSALYAALGNYAYNTGKVFIGDPNGLSAEAVSRRLENMISLALKFGTTKFIRPHAKQVKGAAGVDGVRWIEGADSHNLRSMIAASYKNVLKQMPEIEGFSYDSKTDSFLDADGNEYTSKDFESISKLTRDHGTTKNSATGVLEREGIPFTVGGSTVRRALLTHTFLRGTSEEQSQLLAATSGELSESSPLRDILYSLTPDETNETRSQGGFSASEVGKKIPFVKDRILRNEQTQSLPPTLQESYSRLGDKTLGAKIKQEVKRQLTPAGLLPSSIYDLKIARDGEINANELQTRHTLQGFYDAVKAAYGKEYNLLSGGTKREINKVLRGEQGAQLAPSVITALQGMRDDIKRLSIVYVRQLASEAADLREQGKDVEAESKERLIETVSDKFDTYLNRSYRAFDDKNWPSKVPAKVYKDAVEFLASEYAGDDPVTSEHIATAEKRAHLILKEGTAFDSMGAFISEGKLGSKDLSILKKLKYVPAPIRALLGEYEDAAVNYVKSVTKMSRLVHNNAFLHKMKSTAFDLGLLHEKQNLELDATKKIAADGSEAYAPLNGLYTTPEFEQALKDAMGKHNPNVVYDAIVAANGMVKIGKTVLAPTTAFRNFMSSLFFTFANGHFDYSQGSKSIKAMQVYFKDKGDQSVKDYMVKLRKLGVIYDSPYAGEMMDLLKDSRLADWVDRKESFLAKATKSSLEFSQKFYAAGDDFYKIIGFENEKNLLMKHKGLSEAAAEKEAAERIRNTYPTYSMVGRGMNVLRRFPIVGSFVSFPAEIIRTSYNITKYLHDDAKELGWTHPMVMRKVAGYAIAAGAIAGISMLSAAMMGVGDDEDKAVRAMAPDWQKNSSFLWLGKDDKGKRQYIDLSFLDPYGYWKRPIMAAIKNDSIGEAAVSGAKDLLSPFFGWDIAAKAIGETAFNSKSSGGKVYNEMDSAGGIAADIANHLRKALQPGFATNIERFILAAVGTKTTSGKEYNIDEEVAGLFGWRVATFDPRTALYYQSFNYQQNKSDAAKLLSTVATNVNSVSDDDIRHAYAQSMQARSDAFSDMEKIVSAARSAGMTDAQLILSLRASGVSIGDARALIANKPPRYEPSKTMMKGAIKKASVMFDDETKAEFIKRQKYINDLRSKTGGHLLSDD